MGVGAYVAALATIPPAIKDSTAARRCRAALRDVELGFLPAVGAATARHRRRRAGRGHRAHAHGGERDGDGHDRPAGDRVRGVRVLGRGHARRPGPVRRPGADHDLVGARPSPWPRSPSRACSARAGAGSTLRASREDALAASALGVDVVRLRLGAWVLSAALMGAGGALWAQYNLAFGPRQFFFAQTFAVLAMIVVGGLASVSAGR